MTFIIRDLLYQQPSIEVQQRTFDAICNNPSIDSALNVDLSDYEIANSE